MESASRSLIFYFKPFNKSSPFSFKSFWNKFQPEDAEYQKALFLILVQAFGAEIEILS